MDKKNIWTTWSNALKSNLIHEFTMLNYDRTIVRKDYGTGHLLTGIEAHILQLIYFNEFITVTELSVIANRTKSAISQIVKKLINRGLVRREIDEDHNSKYLLSTTRAGDELTEAHQKYDELMAGTFLTEVAKDFSDEEMNHFFEVFHEFVDLLKKNQ